MRFPIPFAKMSGTGNDFILVDNRARVVEEADMSHLARQACRRGPSVGADGLILLERDTDLDFAWRFFNSDGSEAAMCGNGARCAARFALLKGLAASEMTFRTLAGPIHASVQGRLVRVQLTPPRGVEESFPLELADGSVVEAGFVDTGVPHTVLVLPAGRLERAPVEAMGREIRFHPRFAPAGTNVNFAEVTGPGALRVRTYERGVEGETLACGTGAVASALIAVVRGMIRPPVTVSTRGGDVLRVHLDAGDPAGGEVFLEGETSLVYLGQLTDETVGGG